VTPSDERSWFVGEKVISDGKLLMMTPIDPVFLLIPILQLTSAVNYRPADDIFEAASPTCGKDIISFGSLECVQNALRLICDMKEIAPQTFVYRFSQNKVVPYLQAKVTQLLASDGLEASKTITRFLAKDGLMEDGKEELLKAGRTRAACDLISHYLSPENRTLLLASYDFGELDIYLQETVDVLPSLTTEIAKKKSKEEKTKEEGKKRKNAKGSLGVEKLKKANIDGMTKLSSFFNKV